MNDLQTRETPAAPAPMPVAAVDPARLITGARLDHLFREVLRSGCVNPLLHIVPAYRAARAEKPHTP